jgi:hypothetical protein
LAAKRQKEEEQEGKKIKVYGSEVKVRHRRLEKKGPYTIVKYVIHHFQANWI